jgi:predicted XRE-type DNA-binding protein
MSERSLYRVEEPLQHMERDNTMTHANSVNGKQSNFMVDVVPEATPLHNQMKFSEVENKNLRFRLHLMLKLLNHIRREQLTEQQAMQKLGANTLAIQCLLQRKTSVLTTDELLNMLEQCGLNIYEQLMGTANE